MSYFEFPHTRTYDSDLGWLIKKVGEGISSIAALQSWASTHQAEYKALVNKVNGLIENLTDVIVPWDSSIAYRIFSMVEYQGTNYIALQDVPVGVMITNTAYWQPANTIVEQINAISTIVSEIQEQYDIDLCAVHCPYKSTASQGDCTIFECGNEVVLIDFGTPDHSDQIINYMVDHGLTKVTRVIITHYHYDHVSGYENILGSDQLDFSDAVFYVPPTISASEITGNESYITNQNNYMAYVTALGNEMIVPANNSITEFGDLKCRWLNVDPTEWRTNGYYTNMIDSNGETTDHTSMNNFCIVTEFTHGKNKILWTADIENLAERVVQAYITESPKLFKMQHHGVNEVDNNSFCNKMNPDYVMVEGIGFPVHYQHSEFSQQLIHYNRKNIYTHLNTSNSVVFISTGTDILPYQGKLQVINESFFDVTADTIDSFMVPGEYRVNGIELFPDIWVYGKLEVFAKGSVIIQQITTTNRGTFRRFYSTSASAWREWQSDGLSTYGDGTVNTANFTSSSSVYFVKNGNLVWVTFVGIPTSANSEVDGSSASLELATGLPVPYYTSSTETAGASVQNYGDGTLRPVIARVSQTGSLVLNARGNGFSARNQGSFCYIARDNTPITT